MNDLEVSHKYLILGFIPSVFFTILAKPFWKIRRRYTKKQHSSGCNEVVRNVKVVKRLLCDLRNLSFIEVSWYRFQPFCAIADYLSAWIENQSRTPNDRCAFEKSLTSFLNKEIEWAFRNKYKQNKTLRFCPTTEDKEIKLLWKLNKIRHFVIIYWCGRQIDFLEAVIEYIKKKLWSISFSWQILMFISWRFGRETLACFIQYYDRPLYWAEYTILRCSRLNMNKLILN